MTVITEIFVMMMKNPGHAEAVRERARADFLQVDGVDSRETNITTDPKLPTLYAEIYEFPDLATAKRVNPQFAEREATKNFLAEIDELMVGQCFTQLNPAGN